MFQHLLLPRPAPREVGRQRQGLLSRFMSCLDGDEELGSIFRDEKEKKKKFLRDIIVCFIPPGKDTTSAALTWFFWLLTRNPRCEQKIFAEILLHYLNAAVSGTLWLYPSVPFNSRLTAADDVLSDGTHVEAGWFTDYSAYEMARMERVWGEDCEKFVPEKFVQMKSVAAAVLLRFQVEVPWSTHTETSPPYQLFLTLKVKGGFPVRLKRRIRDV